MLSRASTVRNLSTELISDGAAFALRNMLVGIATGSGIRVTPVTLELIDL
jgi:hypothetical protein